MKYLGRQLSENSRCGESSQSSEKVTCRDTGVKHVTCPVTWVLSLNICDMSSDLGIKSHISVTCPVTWVLSLTYL